MIAHKKGAASTAIDATSSELNRSSSSKIADFYWLLNYRRLVATGVIPEPRGFYYGDGVARNFSGQPFEPLNWVYLREGNHS